MSPRPHRRSTALRAATAGQSSDETTTTPQTRTMVFHIFVGSYTDDVTTLLFDPDAKTLISVATVTVGFHPSWLAFHPSDSSIVFAGLEQPEGEVATVKFDKDGQGTVLGKVKSGGHSPCALVATPSEVLVGNYMGGTLASIPIANDAPGFLKAELWVKKFEFKEVGPDPERQESSHPHHVIFHPDREELLVPDLGGDKTWRLAKDESGKWEVKGHVDYKPGSGPRHVAFHNDILYTLLELSSEVAVHRFPPLPAQPAHITTLPTMTTFPGPPASLGMLAAEILIPTPNSKFATPYMYVSNRNDPSESDVISIFDVSDAEKVHSVAEVRSDLNHLRGMVFGGPDDRYLVAGGANGRGVKIFERTDGGKGLVEVARVDLVAPTAFLWKEVL